MKIKYNEYSSTVEVTFESITACTGNIGQCSLGSLQIHIARDSDI